MIKRLKPVDALLALGTIAAVCLAIAFQLRHGGKTLQIDFVQTPAYDFDTQLVYVNGAINSPGVYELVPGARVIDVIETAGGFRAEVDPVSIAADIDLAAQVVDMQTIYIPFLEQSTISESPATSTTEGKININQASSSELMELPGVGESTAAKIIAARPFTSIEGLLDVPGIGEAKYAKLKDLVEL
jgi:competence protein ComEA